ncbi:hypothetical protein Tcan_08357 [Toxocara canis]|uniref:DUF19 domain-containing protein n=1 Tax=Toxocara canis TaxID=6265 RepID=A0A0B2VZY6_TOXCA|nr:hypothetical protein Tcan_08357 [Toxocara canis]
MINFRQLFLLVLWIRSLLALHQCPHRTNEMIQQCVQPIAQYAKVLNQQENLNTSRNAQKQFGHAISLPKLGGDVFKELCRLIRNFDECVLEYRTICPKHITINLIDASYGFLCNEGYDTDNHAMELDQKPSVKYCHDETLADIERANHEFGITMPLKLDRMCDALNFFSGCVRLPIRHNCGVSAWSVIFRVLRDTTKTLMPGCQFTGQSSSHRIPTTQSTTITIRKISPINLQSQQTYHQEDEIDERKSERNKPNTQDDEKSNRRSEYRSLATDMLDVEPIYYESRKTADKQNGHRASQQYTTGNFGNRSTTVSLIVILLSICVMNKTL